ncbi:MAG: phosphonate ABC transporter, permease protein PhnE [Hyphomicrobiales bacterium]
MSNMTVGQPLNSTAAIEVPKRPFPDTARRWLFWLILVALLIWSWNPTEMYLIENIFTDWRNMAEFGEAFLSPSSLNWEAYVEEMLVTLQIAIWGTALAVVVGIPLAILSASNVAPVWVVQPIRRLMDSFRAINELVFAMVFIVAVGLGPFAGVMALFVHNTGVVAKLFSEAVEAIDPRPVEGIRATGSSRLNEVIFGIVPQVIPLWISYTLYRFETNVRSATVLGLVGAGGIGFSLNETMRGFEYAETATIIIIIIISVSLIDVLSAQLRKMII